MIKSQYIDWTDPDQAARFCAGNWREFDSFVWWDKQPEPDDWMIYYTHHRDSDLLSESNAAVFERLLKREQFENDVRFERHNHSLVGWIDGFSLRVWRQDDHDAVTDAFRVFCKLMNRLESYPVLDEEDWSRREDEAREKSFIENWQYLATYRVVNMPEEPDWTVYGAIMDDGQCDSDYIGEDDILERLSTMDRMIEDEEGDMHYILTQKQEDTHEDN